MTHRPPPAQQLALWADMLRDISARGLRFSQNIYDRENYARLQNLALEMLALATGETLAALEPLRATVFARPSPVAVGDGAVIDAEGAILLIRRADNGLWAMPGGLLDVGETPAQGVAREVLEETGVRCEPVQLVGVHDSRLCGTTSRHHLYHFLFLCRPLGSEPGHASHAVEVHECRWFPETALPAALDPGHVSRIAAAFRAWRGECRAEFDW